MKKFIFVVIVIVIILLLVGYYLFGGPLPRYTRVNELDVYGDARDQHNYIF